jgi:hypothetical protein
MILPSETRFVEETIKESFYKLEKGDSSEKELYSWLIRAFEDIEKNAFCGIQVPKN